MSKIEEHAGIQIPIYYYEDDNGNKVYDFEEMANEFEQKQWFILRSHVIKNASL